MKLREYIEKQNITISEFAAHLGYSREHVTNIANLARKPSRQMAVDIEKLTNGEVSRNELLWPEDYGGL